ncbi:MAG: hypothetical protein AMXMBFR13_48830 [Phycisphaerae bacterium]
MRRAGPIALVIHFTLVLQWANCPMPCALAEPVVTSRPVGPTGSCATAECHADKLSGKVLHAPAGQRKCTACHTVRNVYQHTFDLALPEQQLCTFCHVQGRRTFVHQPVANGACTGCHDPHGSNHRALLLADPAGGLCLRCHEASNEKHIHGPVAAGACVVCHEPHSSWHPNLLSARPEVLCQACHEDVVENLERVRHPHEPALTQQCLTCHNPHSSDQPNQLRKPARELCTSCHEHARIGELVRTSPHVHGAVGTEDSCSACHSGHGGMLPRLLKEPLMGLCLSCHDRPLDAPDGSRIADMAALLKNNPDHHGPVGRADCVACHNPHASPNFRLLSREYPQMFYAPFEMGNYDLCFTCHVKEMVTSSGGEGVTGFRDGERNLHFVHVHKEEKGRTCRACHEVHASQRPFHIREKVPFGSGGWEIEINFELRPGGGRCAPGCHEEKTYRRAPSTGGASIQPQSPAEASS